MSRLRLGGALLAGLLVLELGLQAAAGWMARERAGDAAFPSVLCVGDAYTYGQGASTPNHAYPRELERRLRRSGFPRARVATGALPMASSGDILTRLPAQLAEHRPGFVYVMTGGSDTVLRPGLVEMDPPPDLWPEGPTPRLEWLTGRLLARVSHGLRRDVERVRAPPAPGVGPAYPSSLRMEQARFQWRRAVDEFARTGTPAGLRAARDRFSSVFGRRWMGMLYNWIDEMSLEGTTVLRVKAVIGEADKGTLDEIARIYEAHLLSVARVTAAQGARAIFVSYPYFLPAPLGDALRRVAAQGEGGLLELRAALDEVEAHSRADYIAANGHLRDPGHALLARLVADDLVARLEAPSPVGVR